MLVINYWQVLIQISLIDDTNSYLRAKIGYIPLVYRYHIRALLFCLKASALFSVRVLYIQDIVDYMFDLGDFILRVLKFLRVIVYQ